MIRSYRVWSAVMGAWYLVAVASLLRHPPGGRAVVQVAGRGVVVPEHQTYFQVGVGLDVSTALFALLGVLLIVAAALTWSLLKPVHLVGLVWCFVFGVGYVVAGVSLGEAWISGALALVCSAAHLLIVQLRSAAVSAQALAIAAANSAANAAGVDGGNR